MRACVGGAQAPDRTDPSAAWPSRLIGVNSLHGDDDVGGLGDDGVGVGDDGDGGVGDDGDGWFGCGYDCCLWLPSRHTHVDICHCHLSLE